jgi:hypothetical protein
MVDGKRALLWTLWGRQFGFNWWHWGDGLIAALHVRSLDLLQPSSEAELVPCSSFLVPRSQPFVSPSFTYIYFVIFP